MPTILLIGKRGQVGSELLPLLPQIGNLIALDRQQLDLGHSEDIRRVVRHTRPSIIINAAAYTAVDKAESERDIAYAVNADAPAIIAEEAKKIGSVLVHYSTDYIFDGLKLAPYTESDPTNPLSVYGSSKLSGEIGISQSGACHLIFRISWVYGTRGQNFLLNLLRLGSTHQEIKMVCDQVGTPNCAGDIARMTVSILKTLSANSGASSFEKVSGIYHMSAAGATTRYDFAKAIVEEMRQIQSRLSWIDSAMGGHSFILQRLIPIASAEFPAPAVRPPYSVLSNAHFSEAFGIRLPDWRSRLRTLFSDQI